MLQHLVSKSYPDVTLAHVFWRVWLMKAQSSVCRQAWPGFGRELPPRFGRKLRSSLAIEPATETRRRTGKESFMVNNVKNVFWESMKGKVNDISGKNGSIRNRLHCPYLSSKLLLFESSVFELWICFFMMMVTFSWRCRREQNNMMSGPTRQNKKTLSCSMTGRLGPGCR